MTDLNGLDFEQVAHLQRLTSETLLEVELWLLWLHDLDARIVRLEERRELEAGEPLCMCAGARWSDA